MTKGSGSVIAIVDSGVTNHSDLNLNILSGYDFTPDNNGGNGSDPGITTETCSVTWHGTHVAGIAAALTNNSVGIAGVAPAAKVVPVRVLNACGKGFMSSIADGITWAAGGSVPNTPVTAHRAKVINLSLGGLGDCDKTMQSAIDYATSEGAVVVVAAGNNGVDAAYFQPANCRNVISVGGSAPDGTNYGYSNYGPAVDVAAPSTSILSTYNDGTSTPGAEGYRYLTGTSMAAPFVSGVVALAQSVAPTPLTYAEMRTLIQQNVQPFAPNTPNNPIGQGIVDATATVAAAKSGNIPIAADFACSQAVNIMQVKCKDLSTSRGGAPICSWVWNFYKEFREDQANRTYSNSVDPYANYEDAGEYLIRLKVTDSNGTTSTLTRAVSVVAPTVFSLDFDIPYLVSLPSYEMRYLQLDIPTGLKSMTVNLVQGRANDGAWLFLARSPTPIAPYCQSGMGNNHPAVCKVTNPVPGPYFVIVSGTTDLESAKLTATYEQ
ncbi:S8 family serine peptidase [Caballeronia sordidicola]|uniref:S8 family serine peptidase n=1 Tax=Caballeronia sordidicola TaxID=196367 RepID=UPI0006923D0F|nr:S8 family serine peptidase [Caballeronia sordidicola]